LATVIVLFILLFLQYVMDDDAYQIAQAEFVHSVSMGQSSAGYYGLRLPACHLLKEARRALFLRTSELCRPCRDKCGM